MREVYREAIYMQMVGIYFRLKVEAEKLSIATLRQKMKTRTELFFDCVPLFFYILETSVVDKVGIKPLKIYFKERLIVKLFF